MKSTDKLFKLAERFSRKISLAQDGQEITQAMEAPDFFFGKGYGLKTFVASLGRLSVQGDKAVGDKGLAALMAAFFNKTQQNVNVTISVSVQPGKGANWVTNITPAAFIPTAMAELNKQYQAVTGKTWLAGQVAAANAAKTAKQVEGPGNVQIFDAGL
jgi:hypothetical protein